MYLTPLKEANLYCVVDIEATCWERKRVKDNNEIIEIGAVLCDIKGDILGTYQSFVRPVLIPKLSWFCKNLTNIQQRWIDEADTLNIVLPKLCDWASSLAKTNSSEIPWVAFGNWDESCLSRDCERHNLPSPFGKFINLKTLYSDFSGCESCGLKQAIQVEGLTWAGKSHRALDDASNAARLAKLLIFEDTLRDQPPESTEPIAP